MTINPSLIIGLCWIVFLVVWAILATVYGRSGNRSSSLGAVGLRLVLVVTVYLGIFYGGAVRPFGDFTVGAATAGVMLCIVGLQFAVWARVTLGRSWGMPMTLHENPELVTGGPYRYVRHPIYTGLSAMLIGTSLVHPLAAAPCLGLIAYSAFAARHEERDMEKRFPDAYTEYKRRSKFLVPFLL